MTDTEFMQLLPQKTRIDVAREIASPILFSVDAQLVQFEPSENRCSPCDAHDDTDDTPTIHCVSWQRLYDVLVGNYDLMPAFIDREIWTNGYLPVVFRLFAVFQSELTTRIPE